MNDIENKLQQVPIKPLDQHVTTEAPAEPPPKQYDPHLTRIRPHPVYSKRGFKPKPGMGWNPVVMYYPQNKPCVCNSGAAFKKCCQKNMAECLPLDLCVSLYEKLDHILAGTLRLRTQAQVEADEAHRKAMEAMDNEQGPQSQGSTE